MTINLTSKWLIIVISAVVAWVAVIVLSGLGWNPFGANWNFGNTGTFGDSFGPLSACMAALAAMSAISALNSQREEITRLKEREQSEDERSHKGDFERTFFQLLQALREIISSIDIEGSGSTKQGQDAFRAIVYFYRNSNPSRDPSAAWARTYSKYRNDLGHYFRFLYHLIKFVDEDDGIDRYFYVRLIRASLSDSEFFLVALNCAYGEGYDRFKPLVEKYAFLHNLSADYRVNHQLEDLFKVGAFEPNLADIA